MAAGGAEGRPSFPARVFCDTSYFYACADTGDMYHRQALAMAGEAVKPGLHVADYGAEVRVEAEHVFRRHGRDHRLSFCDAISFVVVTTLLDPLPCFAFDEDSRRLGLSVLAPPQ